MNSARILEETVIELVQKVREMNDRNKATQPTEQQLWEELVACTLGSRVVFETAYSAFSHLRNSGSLLLSNESLGTSTWRNNAARELNRSLFLPPKLNGIGRKYPFARLRSNHINKTWRTIYGAGITLNELLSKELEPKRKRINLMNYAWGIGPKQASLFLRNSCLSNDVAILDSHVLRYMAINRLLSLSVKTVNSLSVYEQIEDRLQRYAESLRTTLSEIDVAIWVTMRVFLKELRG